MDWIDIEYAAPSWVNSILGKWRMDDLMLSSFPRTSSWTEHTLLSCNALYKNSSSWNNKTITFNTLLNDNILIMKNFILRMRLLRLALRPRLDMIGSLDSRDLVLLDSLSNSHPAV